jgi:uncharacterized Ntn-hydrolase superfamily protein
MAATRVLDELTLNDEFVERRQLGCLDTRGGAAGRTGSANRPWAGHRVARNVVAAANAVTDSGVTAAMFDSFQSEPHRPLWERLLSALEAGKKAGGEPNGEKSGGLYVVGHEPFAIVDLRVDLHPEPVAKLRRLANDYFPLIPYYMMRPTDPTLPRAAEWLAARRATG